MNEKSLVKLNTGLFTYIPRAIDSNQQTTSFTLKAAVSEREGYEREKEDDNSRGHGSFLHGC